MIQIDGSYGSGGGQIVRTALAFATLFQKPFEIINIRKGRSVPGLKAQHLHCIYALEKLCNAKTSKIEIGSEKLRFIPNKINSSKISIDIGTAGSVTLVLQCLMLPCLLAKKSVRIEITGGTDVKWSPQIDYFKEIIMPYFSEYAEKLELNIEKRGYYPEGCGKIMLKIKPRYNIDNIKNQKFKELIEQGNLIQIKGISHASKDLMKKEVAERQANSAKMLLSYLNVPIKIDPLYSETLSTGSGITLVAIFSNEYGQIGYIPPIKIGADELGEKGKSSEDVGRLVALKLIEEIKSGAPVDRHMADNLIPLMSLLKSSKIKTSAITKHTLTNIYVVEQFIGKKFKIENNTIYAL